MLAFIFVVQTIAAIVGWLTIHTSDELSEDQKDRYCTAIMVILLAQWPVFLGLNLILG